MTRNPSVTLHRHYIGGGLSYFIMQTCVLLLDGLYRHYITLEGEPFIFHNADVCAFCFAKYSLAWVAHICSVSLYSHHVFKVIWQQDLSPYITIAKKLGYLFNIQYTCKTALKRIEELLAQKVFLLILIQNLEYTSCKREGHMSIPNVNS